MSCSDIHNDFEFELSHQSQSALRVFLCVAWSGSRDCKQIEGIHGVYTNLSVDVQGLKPQRIFAVTLYEMFQQRTDYAPACVTKTSRGDDLWLITPVFRGDLHNWTNTKSGGSYIMCLSNVCPFMWENIFLSSSAVCFEPLQRFWIYI